MAGELTAAFTVNGQSDNIVDGDQPVTLTASSLDLSSTESTSLNVTDIDMLRLMLALGSALVVEGNSVEATVTLTTPSTQGTTVNLFVSDGSEASLSVTSVEIPAGSTMTTVNVNGLADNLVDGDQAITFTAVIAGGTSEAATGLSVIDADDLAMTLSLDGDSISETESTTATVTLTTLAADDVSVTLVSSDVGEATVGPANVVIPAGET